LLKTGTDDPFRASGSIPSKAVFAVSSILFRSLFNDVTAFGGRRLVLGVLLAGIGAGLEGIGLVMLIPLLKAAGVGGESSYPWLNGTVNWLGLPGLLVVWVGIIAIHSFLTARREMGMARLTQGYIAHLRERLHAAVLAMDWAAFQTVRSSEIVATLTGTANRVGNGLSNLIQMGGRLLLIVIHTTIAVAVAPGAALLALAIGTVLIVSQIPRLRQTIRQSGTIGERQMQVHTAISEHVSAMKLAKAHNAESGFAATFSARARQLGDDSARLGDDWAQSRARQRVAASILLAVVTWISVTLLDITGAPLLLLIAVFSRLVPGLSEAAHLAMRIAEMLPAYAEIEDLRRRCAEAAAPPPEAIPAPTGPLRLENVVYRWQGRDETALSDISLVIPERGTVALVGPSGAGKSTLADLCLGLLVPTTGTIRVGDTPLTGPQRAAWRDRAAIVPQEVFLFHDTVRANLTWTRPEASEDEIWQALDAAAAATLVRRLPKKLDTQLGDRGIWLSGGERQRLALARALLRRPSFLILDEATSHLDRDHERQIQDSLEKLHGRLSVLVIAHRLATVRHADHIIVLDQSRIVESGTWDQLVQSGGWIKRSLD